MLVIHVNTKAACKYIIQPTVFVLNIDCTPLEALDLRKMIAIGVFTNNIMTTSSLNPITV
jgi:hypothetical protein